MKKVLKTLLSVFLVAALVMQFIPVSNVRADDGDGATSDPDNGIVIQGDEKKTDNGSLDNGLFEDEENELSEPVEQDLDDETPNDPVGPANTVRTLYVSSEGDDVTGDGSFEKPYATIKKCSDVINNAHGGYNIFVLTDLESAACGRFYDSYVTILSADSETGEPTENAHTITRAEGFSSQADNNRSWYNPSMFEIQTTSSPASLSLYNIIIDDNGRHEGSAYGKPDGLTSVQPAIIESNAIHQTTITLGDGAVLKNYGGNSAIKITTEYVNLVMESGSKICDDLGSTRKNGTAVLWITAGALTMNEGSMIENTCGKNVMSVSNSTILINGEISNCDATGSHVIQTAGNTDITIGASGYIHDNIGYYGIVYLNSRNENLDVYGRINHNYGSRYGAIVVANNGSKEKNVTLHSGSQICNNISDKDGGGALAVFLGTLTMEDGSLISGNIAKASGGAVYVRKGGIFIMNGGTITKNYSTGFAGAVDFDGFDYGGNVVSAQLNAGSIFDNYGKCETSGTMLDIAASGGNSANLSVNYNAEHKTGVSGGSVKRNLSISSELDIDDSTVYFTKDNKSVFAATDLMINNATASADAALSGAAMAKSWNILTTFWRQSDAADYYVDGIEYDPELPVYVIEIDVDDNGEPVNGSEKYIKASTKGDSIIASLLESSENGRAVAIVQPTKDYGEIAIETTESINKVTGASEYPVNYSVEFEPSESLLGMLELENEVSGTITVVLDEILTGSEEIAVESEMFKVNGQISVDGNVVSIPVTAGGTGSASITVTGLSILDAADFEPGNTLNCTVQIELAIGDTDVFIPGNIAKTELLDVEMHTVTIDYLFEDGTVAAEKYSEELETGTTFDVESPVVEGFTPDTKTVLGVVESEDIIITVTYKKTSNNTNPPSGSSEGGSSNLHKPVVNTSVK